MAIITGDTHGVSFNKFSNSKTKSYDLGYTIIAGDAGILFDDSDEEKYWIEWLNEKPFETIACLGNHENFERIYNLPLVEHLGGFMYKLSDKIWFAQHGNIYTIEDKTFLFFGGAQSKDKEDRINRVTWWREEILTVSDFYRVMKAVADVNGKVDYVISHTAPMEAVDYLFDLGVVPDCGYKIKQTKTYDATIPMLDSILDSLDKAYVKGWFFGHFHNDKDFQINKIKYHLLFNRLYEV